MLEETESESYGDSPVGSKIFFSCPKIILPFFQKKKVHTPSPTLCSFCLKKKKKIAEDEFMTKQKGELDMKKSVSRYKEEKEKEKPIYKRRTVAEMQDFDGSNNNNVSSHYSKNKKAVQQTKQLLFDCIREVVELEKHKKKNGSSEGQQLKGIVGSEQLWELICENLCLWSKESINETNVIHLPHSEVLLVSSAQEWKWSSDLEKQTQVIGSQLGDAILEDICNEMIIFCTDK